MSLRVPPPLWLLFFIAAIYGLSRFYPIAHIAFMGQSWLILLLCFMGAILGFAAVIAFAKANTTIDPRHPHKTSRLVTLGIYRFSRNPMYLGLVFFLTAGALYFSALSGFLMVPTFIFVMTHLQIKPEEEVLLALFGNEYQQYCQQVRRWW